MIDQKINSAPNSAGVYLFKSKDSKVVYVGKAKNIKKRLLSYLRDDVDVKTSVMIKKAVDVEYITTIKEADALILEANLIKKYRPAYNIRLKDDKAYPYIKIDLNQDWCRLEVVRKRIIKKGVQYFGPYPNAFALKETVFALRKIFPLRKCKDEVFKRAKRPCIFFDTNVCLAPCAGKISKNNYAGVVNSLIAVLNGKIKDVIAAMEKEMFMASDSMEYEEAQKIRDRIKYLQEISQKQAVVLPNSDQDIDIIAYELLKQNFVVNVLMIRKGVMVGHANYKMHGEADSVNLGLNRFIVDYYSDNYVPSKVYVQTLEKTLEEDEFALNEYLRKQKVESKKIFFTSIPSELNKMFAISKSNLQEYVRNNILSANAFNLKIEELNKIFSNQSFVSTSDVVSVECYDMSNISGTSSVGVRIVFYNASPEKSLYRKYKIQGDFKGNDLLMMQEVMQRRLKKAMSSEDPFCDYILIDGGRTQLGAIYEVLKSEIKVKRLKILGIAKDRTKSKSTSEDKIYKLEDDGLIKAVKVSDDLLKYLKNIRDETHRFAITYHRKVRGHSLFD